MATTEQTIDDALGALLIETRSLWRFKGVVKSENVDALKGSGKKPDILITEPNVSPVIVETEILPSNSVESDAKQRLGERLSSGRRILSSIGIRLPIRSRDFSGKPLKDEILNASDFDMALYTGESPESFTRWPQNGWMRGNIVDLSILVQSAAVPPAVTEEAANNLVDGVSEAVVLLEDMATAHAGAIIKI